MTRVMVIGCPGAGKSVFSRELHERTGLPLVHLDMIWHRPDRTNISREEFDARLARLVETDRWIIDGNYNRTLEVRMEKCDTVIFFDLPTDVCLDGARSRVGKKRDDMPWAETELDPEFREWIEGFRESQNPKIEALIEKYRDTREIVTFKTRGESEDFLNKIG